MQWVILLGDNGAGKTTLLQTLAAITPRRLEAATERVGKTGPSGKAQQTHYIPDIFLSHPADERFSSFLRVGAAGFKISAQLAFGAYLTKKDSRLELSTIEAKINNNLGGSSASVYPPRIRGFQVYAYGSARRIGKAALSETRDSDPRSTLFDESCPLLNAEEWLLQADYAAERSKEPNAAQRRDRIKQILVRLLPDVYELRIETSATQTAFVEARTPFGWVKMRSLSSGYRSVVAWMVDFASRLFDRYPQSEDPLAEPAVVLVDQIDLLLHPKWQRELVHNLTSIFCNTQFIVTAHSPLIVQAATNAKIVLLRRESDHVIIDNRAESVRGWRLDQIISSDLFEKLGTRDPHTEELLKERKTLLTKPSLSLEEKDALQRIEEELKVLRFGETAEHSRAMEIIERAAEQLQNQEP